MQMKDVVSPSFLQRSEHTFDVVDHKVAETEFFLRKLFEASDGFEFNCFLSAYLSAARTVTLSLQRFGHLPRFDEWYGPHRSRLRENPIARLFLDLRNEHVHGGMYPSSGSVHKSGPAKYFFRGGNGKPDIDDLAGAALEHFVSLLSVIHDCYVVLGVHIDPQQHYTAENFARNGRGIDDAECEVWGWVCSSAIEEGCSDDDRWHELRGHVDECHINHLFFSYLGKSTPQPPLPDYLEETEPTPEERGWIHTPAGRDVAVNRLDNDVMAGGACNEPPVG